MEPEQRNGRTDDKMLEGVTYEQALQRFADLKEGQRILLLLEEREDGAY